MSWIELAIAIVAAHAIGLFIGMAFAFSLARTHYQRLIRRLSR